MKPVYYHQFAPSAVLKPYIRSYFFIRTPSAKVHIPADGCPGLIINLKDPFLFGFRRDQLTPFKYMGCDPYLIRGVGVEAPGEVKNKPEIMAEAEEMARKLVLEMT